jgi:hypothetical protein
MRVLGLIFLVCYGILVCTVLLRIVRERRRVRKTKKPIRKLKDE